MEGLESVENIEAFSLFGEPLYKAPITLWLRARALERNGKRLEDYYFSGFAAQVTVNESDEEYEAMAKRIAERSNRSVEDVKGDVFSGTPEALVEKFRKAEDLGVKMMVVYIRPAATIEEMKERLSRFNDEVIKEL